MDKYTLYYSSRAHWNQCDYIIFKHYVFINELEFIKWDNTKRWNINCWSNLIIIFIVVNSLNKIFWKESTFNMGAFVYCNYTCLYITLQYILIEYNGTFDDNIIFICILSN